MNENDLKSVLTHMLDPLNCLYDEDPDGAARFVRRMNFNLLDHNTPFEFIIEDGDVVLWDDEAETTIEIPDEYC